MLSLKQIVMPELENMPHAKRLQAVSDLMKGASKLSNNGFNRGYECHYCLDTKFLAVFPEWLADGDCIGVTMEDIAICEARDVRQCFFVPCDCHPGQISGKDVNRFAKYFGLPIYEHDLGAWMIQYRRDIESARSAEDFARAEEARKKQENAA